MIICAAIKIQIEGLDHETVVPALRHGHVYSLLKDLGYAPKTKYKELEQGFLTNKNKFLNRRDALKHAIEHQQISNVTAKEELYSEDLY